METRLTSGVINSWTLLLTFVRGNRSHLLSLCQEQQVTSSDSLRGQSAMPHVSVPAQQIDSDDEATALFTAGSFVIDQEHDERVWATLDAGLQRRMSQRELGISCRTIFRHVWFSVRVSRGHQKQDFHRTWWQHGCRSWTSQVSVCTCFHC